MSSPPPPPGPIPGNNTTSAISALASVSASSTSTPNALQPGTLLTGGASPPLIIGFISVGAFALAIISICAWSRFVGRRSVLPDAIVERYYRFVPVSFRHGREREGWEEEEGEGGLEEGGEGEQRRGRRRRRRRRGRVGERERDGAGASVDLGGKTKPEMFDAWISRRRRSVDIFKKWGAESMPFSATLFTTTTGAVAVETCVADADADAAVEELSSRAGDSVEEDDGEEKLAVRREGRTDTGTTGSRSTLQVAVLLQMPSPRHDAEGRNPIRRELLGHRGELAIGLIEVPCTREQHYSHERTTTS